MVLSPLIIKSTLVLTLQEAADTRRNFVWIFSIIVNSDVRYPYCHVDQYCSTSGGSGDYERVASMVTRWNIDDLSAYIDTWTQAAFSGLENACRSLSFSMERAKILCTLSDTISLERHTPTILES